MSENILHENLELIKNELFDSPDEIKRSFNTVVEYFENNSNPRFIYLNHIGDRTRVIECDESTARRKFKDLKKGDKIYNPRDKNNFFELVETNIPSSRSIPKFKDLVKKYGSGSTNITGESISWNFKDGKLVELDYHDSLSFIKDQLFEAPDDVKESFNSVLNFFAKDPDRKNKLDKAYEDARNNSYHACWNIKDFINVQKLEDGEIDPGFNKIPSSAYYLGSREDLYDYGHIDSSKFKYDESNPKVLYHKEDIKEFKLRGGGTKKKDVGTKVLEYEGLGGKIYEIYLAGYDIYYFATRPVLDKVTIKPNSSGKRSPISDNKW